MKTHGKPNETHGCLSGFIRTGKKDPDTEIVFRVGNFYDLISMIMPQWIMEMCE